MTRNIYKNNQEPNRDRREIRPRDEKRIEKRPDFIDYSYRPSKEEPKAFRRRGQNKEKKRDFLAADVQMKRKLKKIKARKSRNRRLAIAGAVLLLALVFFISPLFKIKEAQLRGLYLANGRQLSQVLKKEVGQHVLFYGKGALEKEILKDPIISKVT